MSQSDFRLPHPLLALLLLALTVGGLTALSYYARVADVAIDHKVFKESHQYKSGMEAKAATYEAQKLELEGQLMNPNMDPEVRANTQAQLIGINARLNALRIQQR